MTSRTSSRGSVALFLDIFSFLCRTDKGNEKEGTIFHASYPTLDRNVVKGTFPEVTPISLQKIIQRGSSRGNNYETITSSEIYHDVWKDFPED